ncbi:hypothetical protein ACFOYU_16660 [Microvirga sp. GCM10011540]|uniref:hypothetical protein n=1 Tax=Microvirga sp. GCM10011540 TaxID=3317338 RepID=UPI00360619EE
MIRWVGTLWFSGVRQKTVHHALPQHERRPSPFLIRAGPSAHADRTRTKGWYFTPV